MTSNTTLVDACTALKTAKAEAKAAKADSTTTKRDEIKYELNGILNEEMQICMHHGLA